MTYHCASTSSSILKKRTSTRCYKTITEGAKLLVLSCAPPGQKGHHHVNEQPRRYWIAQLKKRGWAYQRRETGPPRAAVPHGTRRPAVELDVSQPLRLSANTVRQLGRMILYEDEALLVIDKPAWSVVHPTRGAHDALILTNHFAARNKPVFPVHRLDRQTSGVLVFARSSAIARTLCSALQAAAWKKEYVALCRGLFSAATTIEHSVKDEKKRRMALTEVRPLEAYCHRYTLIHALPHTGRRHQIRQHLKHLSHPLVGDVNYGKGNINRFFSPNLRPQSHLSSCIERNASSPRARRTDDLQRTALF